MEPGSRNPHNMMPFCPANRQRNILNQVLEMFWAQQRYEIENSTAFHVKGILPLARIKTVMKSDPQVKMVSSDTPVLFMKACEIFIQELTIRAWRHTQSCSRQTIRAGDIYEALRGSEILKDLIDLISFEPLSVSHQGVPQRAVHQQAVPPDNVNVPDMKAPIDMDMIQQQSLYNLTADHFINIEDFEVNPNLQ